VIHFVKMTEFRMERRVRGQTFLFRIATGEECFVEYNGRAWSLEQPYAEEFAQHLISITRRWKGEYTDTTQLDGEGWKISIFEGQMLSHEVSGHATYPPGFHVLTAQIDKLVSEVSDGL